MPPGLEPTKRRGLELQLAAHDVVGRLNREDGAKILELIGYAAKLEKHLFDVSARAQEALR